MSLVKMNLRGVKQAEHHRLKNNLAIMDGQACILLPVSDVSDLWLRNGCFKEE